MTAARICLIVDAEMATTSALTDAFRAHGLVLVTAADSGVALDNLSRLVVKAIIVVSHAGGEDPLTVMRLLQEANPAPVLLLTHTHDELDEIIALEMGAADVLSVSASARLILARVRRLLRSGAVEVNSPSSRDMRVGPLQLSSSLGRASIAGQPLMLTTQQFDTLLLLASTPGALVSRDTISRTVRGLPNTDSRSVDVTVSRLRRKLRDCGEHGIQIGAQYGKGYFLTLRSEESSARTLRPAVGLDATA